MEECVNMAPFRHDITPSIPPSGKAELSHTGNIGLKKMGEKTSDRSQNMGDGTGLTTCSPGRKIVPEHDVSNV